MDNTLKLIIKYTPSAEFKWGVSDCATFTGNIIRDLTGIDYFYRFREEYKTSKSALKLLKELNYDNIIDATCGETQKMPVSINYVKTGDIVAIDTGALGYAIGVCYKNYGFFINGKSNLSKVSLDNCVCGWRII